VRDERNPRADEFIGTICIEHERIVASDSEILTVSDVSVDARNQAVLGHSPAVLRRVGSPRISYVTPFWGDCSDSASGIRSQHVERALRATGTVDVVAVESYAQLADKDRVNVASVLRVHSTADRGVAGKIDRIFNPRARYPHGVAVGSDNLETVLRGLEASDLVWFFKLRTANMFPRWAWARSVVDIDDIPSKFEESVMLAEPSTLRRVTPAMRVWSWKRRERLLAQRFTVLAVCSHSDREHLHQIGVDAPIHVIPNGFDRPTRTPARQLTHPPRVGFIGVFDHLPNVAGIHWFAREVWPKIKREVPDARLRVIGRLSDGPSKPSGADIDALGWVADPTDEMATWSAMVVPVRIGAGTRGKIAHAFSQRCPVVSTTLGAYGYGSENGDDMLIADTADTFAAACLRTIRDPQAAGAMAERAWQQFLQKWTWDAIRPQIWAAVDDCLRAGRDRAAQ